MIRLMPRHRDLRTNLNDHLTHRRIDLARHDRRTRLGRR